METAGLAGQPLGLRAHLVRRGGAFLHHRRILLGHAVHRLDRRADLAQRHALRLAVGRDLANEAVDGLDAGGDILERPVDRSHLGDRTDDLLLGHGQLVAGAFGFLLGAHRKRTDKVGDHGETASCLARAARLDRRVHRQHARLESDFVEALDHAVDALGAVADPAHRRHRLVGDVASAPNRGDPGIGPLDRLPGSCRRSAQAPVDVHQRDAGLLDARRARLGPLGELVGGLRDVTRIVTKRIGALAHLADYLAQRRRGTVEILLQAREGLGQLGRHLDRQVAAGQRRQRLANAADDQCRLPLLGLFGFVELPAERLDPARQATDLVTALGTVDRAAAVARRHAADHRAQGDQRLHQVPADRRPDLGRDQDRRAHCREHQQQPRDADDRGLPALGFGIALDRLSDLLHPCLKLLETLEEPRQHRRRPRPVLRRQPRDGAGRCLIGAQRVGYSLRRCRYGRAVVISLSFGDPGIEFRKMLLEARYRILAVDTQSRIGRDHNCDDVAAHRIVHHVRRHVAAQHAGRPFLRNEGGAQGQRRRSAQASAQQEQADHQSADLRGGV